MAPSFTLVLLAAGSARRMEGAVADKTLAPLLGEPVIARARAAFAATGGLTRTVVTYRDDAQRERLAAALGQGKVDAWVRGGADRQDSVLAALEACEGDGLVALHDAARPLVLPSSIRKVLDRAAVTGAAILASRATDTVKLASEQGDAIAASPERARVWIAETPQVFRLAAVRAAYRKAAAEGRRVTDDAAAVSAAGQEVALVEGDGPNPKLTRPADLAIAEAILRSRP